MLPRQHVLGKRAVNRDVDRYRVWPGPEGRRNTGVGEGGIGTNCLIISLVGGTSGPTVPPGCRITIINWTHIPDKIVKLRVICSDTTSRVRNVALNTFPTEIQHKLSAPFTVRFERNSITMGSVLLPTLVPKAPSYFGPILHIYVPESC